MSFECKFFWSSFSLLHRSLSPKCRLDLINSGDLIRTIDAMDSARISTTLVLTLTELIDIFAISIDKY